MKWNLLLIGKEKISSTCIIILYAYPVIILIAKQLTLDTLKLKVALTGGLLYAIFYIAVLMKCPKLIATHKNADEYASHCLTNKVNLFDEFEFLKKLSPAKIQSMLGDHLYPPEKGLNYSRQETIRQYAILNYNFHNSQNTQLRILLGFILLLSVIMINVPAITRIMSALWG